MSYGVRISLFWLKLTCNIQHQVHFRGSFNPDQPSIILARHESTWEALAFHNIFPLQINVVKQELKNIPFFGLILSTIESIVIDRGQGIQSIKKMKLEGQQAIKNGLWLVIFPEGTRIEPGERAELSPGGAMLAKQENVPVYVVAHNAGKFWPKGTFLKVPGVIDVYIEQLTDIKHKSIKEINTESANWFHQPKFESHYLPKEI